MISTSRNALRALVAGLALGALGACGGYHTPEEKLQDATLAYNNGIRWQRFEIAARALPPERRQAWIHAMERLSRTMQVLEYELVPIQVGKELAIVDVDIAFTRPSAMVVERMRRRQTWRYVSGAWQLAGEQEVEAVPEDEAPATWPDLEASPEKAADGR